MNNKLAVILVNLGTPQAPTPKAVGSFLKNFLSDPRVVEVPKIIWWLLLRLVIIPLRAKRVAKAYQAIWMDQGSPLRVISHRQKSALQDRLGQQQIEARVLVGETYGEISLYQQIEKLAEDGFEKILLIPMYPQYSGSTTGAIYDQVAKLYLRSRNVPDIRIVKSFHNHPLYIQALAHSVEKTWREKGKGDKLLVSFHGLPKSCIEKGDPYYKQCSETAELLAAQLALDDDSWQLCFQSRFGLQEWLQPYTDETLKQLGQQKNSRVDIVSPAFVADCLETLEELNVENRQLFLSAGGEIYSFIPCLNDNVEFVELLSVLVKSEWVDSNCVKHV